MEPKTAWDRTYTDHMEPEEKPKKKRYWVAGILTIIIPGLGQWIKGERWHGVLFFFITIILGIVSINFWPIILVTSIIYIYIIYDAFTHQPLDTSQ